MATQPIVKRQRMDVGTHGTVDLACNLTPAATGTPTHGEPGKATDRYLARVEAKLLDDAECERTLQSMYEGLPSFAALSSECMSKKVTMDMPDATEEQYTVVGQCYARRPLNKKMIFLSIRTDGSLAHNCIEILVRSGHSSDDALNNARFYCSVGDVIQVRGCLQNSGNTEGKPLICGSELKRLIAWADQHPSRTFTPFERLPPCLGLPPALKTEYEALRDAGGDDLPASKKYARQERAKQDAERQSSGVVLSQASHAGSAASSSASASASDLPEARSSAASTSKPTPRAGAALQAVMPSAREECWFEGIPLHRLCRYFIANPAGCMRSACGQLHSIQEFTTPELRASHSLPVEVDMGAVKAAWGKWRMRNRALGIERMQGDDEHADVDDRHGHASRANAFADWIVANVPAELLSRGILDVAGGRGDVAFQLAGIHCFPVTTVDPRPNKPRKSQARHWAAHPERAKPNHIQAYFGPTFTDGAANKHLLDSIGLVIGFHPDQATEAIVDYALAHHKPVIIVPCCVFSREFPGRKLLDGAEVNSYQDFVEYLKEKPMKQRADSQSATAAAAAEPVHAAGAASSSSSATASSPSSEAFSTAFLPYNGKNLVLYRGFSPMKAGRATVDEAI